MSLSNKVECQSHSTVINYLMWVFRITCIDPYDTPTMSATFSIGLPSNDPCAQVATFSEMMLLEDVLDRMSSLGDVVCFSSAHRSQNYMVGSLSHCYKPAETTSLFLQLISRV